MALFPGARIPWIDRFTKIDVNGVLVANSNGFVWSYVAGTDDATETWTDVDLTTAHTNPIELDAEGMPPSPIYVSPHGYKFIVTDSDGNQINEEDMVEDIGQTFANTFGTLQSEGTKEITSGYILLSNDRLVTTDESEATSPALFYLCPAEDFTGQLCFKNYSAVPWNVIPDGTESIESISGPTAYSVPAAASPNFPSIVMISDGVSSWTITSSHGL